MSHWSDSASSVWGSASSHVDADGQRRFSMDSLSVTRKTPVTLDITIKSGHSQQLVGSREVVCKTHAEYKANKLNRNEQTKLENVKFRVVKEKELSERKFTQSEKSIRAKSAKIKGRIRTIQSSSFAESQRPRSYAYEKDAKTRSPLLRSRSYPVTPSADTPKNKPCEICEKIQNIIFTYESEGARAGVIDDEVDHSMCVFSDVQVNTFIRMLEAKYFGKVPDLKDKIAESGTSFSPLEQDGKKSREDINNAILRRNLELRIQHFCEELDNINREERNIPEEVKESVERWRIENAILLLAKPPGRQELIINEVKRILNIK